MAFISAFYLMKVMKATPGEILRNGFRYIFIAVIILGLGFLWLGLSEEAEFVGNSWSEFIFESLILLGICFMAAGPISISGETEKLVKKLKKM